MSARENIAYLRGLIEGQSISENAGLSKFHEALLAALDALASEIEGISEEQEDLREYVEHVDEELLDLQSEIEDIDDELIHSGAYEDEDDELDGEEEEYESICCPSCGKDFFYQPAAYDDDEDLLCPHCGEPFVKG